MNKKLSTYKDATPDSEQKYANEIPQLESIKVFSLVLPKWAAENKKDISFLFKATASQSDGLEVQTGMSKNGKMQDLEDINYLLSKQEELMRLKFLYHTLEEYSKDPTFSFKRATNDLYKRIDDLLKTLYPNK